MKMGMQRESDFVGTFAVALARAGDDVQTDFFHEFAAECRSWGFLKAEGQLASVNLKLSDEDRELLAMLGYQEKGGA